MRLPLVGILVASAAGCPGHGWPNERGSNHSNAGASIPGQGVAYCSIYPHNMGSWDAPMQLPPSCPYEGWVRQVVRDIHEIDACASDREPELRVVLGIDKHGVLTSVDVPEPISLDARRCVDHALRGWEFSSAQAAGSLRVVYEPRKAKP